MTIVYFLVALGVLIPFFIKKITVGEVGLRETMGRYTDTIQPGVVWILPGIMSLRKVDVRIQTIPIPEQLMITKDAISLVIDGSISIQIVDPYKATYTINHVFDAMLSLTQASLRSIIGTMDANIVEINRDAISARLLESLDREGEKWGIKVFRVEIQKLDFPIDFHKQTRTVEEMIQEIHKAK